MCDWLETPRICVSEADLDLDLDSDSDSESECSLFVHRYLLPRIVHLRGAPRYVS